MHQTSWVHRHLQACNFVFDPGWRRLRRQWCVHQLFAGRFQDDGAYHKWRVHLWCGDEVYWKVTPSIAGGPPGDPYSYSYDKELLMKPPSRRSRTALLRRLRRSRLRAPRLKDVCVRTYSLQSFVSSNKNNKSIVYEVQTGPSYDTSPAMNALSCRHPFV